MAQDDSEPLKDRIARVTAEQSRHNALKRLARDGNNAEKNIRRRLELLALEKCIPKSEITKALRLRGQNPNAQRPSPDDSMREDGRAAETAIRQHAPANG
jgi:hypothetical protein